MKAEKNERKKLIAIFVISVMVLGGVAYGISAYLKKGDTTTPSTQTLNLEQAIAIGEQYITNNEDYIFHGGRDLKKMTSLEQMSNNRSIIYYEFKADREENIEQIDNGKVTLIIKDGEVIDGMMVRGNESELNGSEELCLNNCGDGYCELIRVKEMYFPCKENITICPKDCK